MGALSTEINSLRPNHAKFLKTEVLVQKTSCSYVRIQIAFSTPKKSDNGMCTFQG